MKKILGTGQPGMAVMQLLLNKAMKNIQAGSAPGLRTTQPS